MITAIRIPVIGRYGYYLRWYYNGWHHWMFYAGTVVKSSQGQNYRTLSSKEVSLSSGQVTGGQINAIRTILNTTEVYLFTDSGWILSRILAGVSPIKSSIDDGYELNITLLKGSRLISESGLSPVSDIPIVLPDVYVPPGGECIIGTQIWMKRNWDSYFPGSKVYDNNIDNLEIYGRLYTFNQIISSGFCPYGWHVPTLAEWITLIDEYGGLPDAGGKLKESGLDHWNTDTTVPPVSCFEARGGGQGNPVPKYSGLKLTGNFWTASEYDATKGYYIKMTHDSVIVQSLLLSKGYYNSVRLIKDTPAPPITFDDWFLPSRYELGAMRTNLFVAGVGEFDVGGGSYYHSSSESTSDPTNTMWCRNMLNNWEAEYQKSQALFVRACRSFIAGVGAYNLRDVGPAGGLIFYIDGVGTTYLEAAPSDQSISKAWSNITGTLIGTTGTAIGTGQANTTAIINQAGHTDSAAKLCDDLVI